MCRQCLASTQPLDAEYFCVACRAPFANEFPLDEQGLCGLCRLGLQGFDGAYSYGFYDGALRDLILLFKYGKVQTLVRPLGELLSRALPRGQAFDCIVPLPMHWRRRWTRGFNQSDLLARELARRCGLRVHSAVKRKRATPPQAGLTSSKRRANVAGSFVVPNPAAVEGRKILLIDDVLTTGATAGACAKALKKAGAATVTLLTVARADRRMAVEPAAAAEFTFSFRQEIVFVPTSTVNTGSFPDGESGSLT